MLIGFIGDIHGRVFHTIAAIATWQRQIGKQIDLLIQVGDLGAFPNLSRLDDATKRHMEADPSEADFSRLLTLTGSQADTVATMREQFKSPIYFIRGNHEDHAWLAQQPIDLASGTANVDPFGLFRYIPDGTILDVENTKIGFLGGAEECTGSAALEIGEGKPTPFADAEFGLVLNRHSAFNVDDLARIFIPGGAFLTQQVHGLYAHDLQTAFEVKPLWPEATPERYVPWLQSA